MDIDLDHFPVKDILEGCRGFDLLLLIPFCSKMVVLNSQEAHIRVQYFQLEVVIEASNRHFRYRKWSYLVILANSILESQHHLHSLE